MHLVLFLCVFSVPQKSLFIFFKVCILNKKFVESAFYDSFQKSSLSLSLFSLSLSHTHTHSTHTRIQCPAIIEFTRKVIDTSIKIFTNILSVQKVNPILKINQCEDIPNEYIDNNLKTKGINADLVIFPYFDLKSNETFLAYAWPCALDPTTRRPNGGLIAFHPKQFFANRKNSLEYYILLVLHEISHILSFSDYLFEYYTDANYNKNNNKNKPYKFSSNV